MSGIEPFLQLESFVADYNHLTEESFSSEHVSAAFAGVETLWLNGNRISRLEKLVEYLKPLKRLGSLSLLRNPGIPSKDSTDLFKQYRCYMIFHLEQLHTLDGKLVSEAERHKTRTLVASLSLQSPVLPLVPTSLEDASKADPASASANAKFLVLLEGNIGLFRIEANQPDPSSLETYWFVLNERQLQWYPDWKAVAPVDIIYLRHQYLLRTPSPDDSIAQKLLQQQSGRSILKLSRSDEKDILYLVFDENSSSGWESALKEQTGQKIRGSITQLAMSEFTRMQEERRQYLQDEDDKRFLDLERRIAALPVEHIDPQEVKFVRVLGMGSFGTVYHATYHDKTVAAKILHEHDADRFDRPFPPLPEITSLIISQSHPRRICERGRATTEMPRSKRSHALGRLLLAQDDIYGTFAI